MSLQTSKGIAEKICFPVLASAFDKLQRPSKSYWFAGGRVKSITKSPVSLFGKTCNTPDHPTKFLNMPPRDSKKSKASDRTLLPADNVTKYQQHDSTPQDRSPQVQAASQLGLSSSSSVKGVISSNFGTVPRSSWPTSWTPVGRGRISKWELL